VTVEYALDRIKNGKSRDLVEKVRKSEKAERNKLKMHLPCVCYSGIFKQRNKHDVVSHSGYICLDFDNINVEQTIEILRADKYIYSCWISPSGNGVKALVRIPADTEKHELYFDALKAQYPAIDKSGRDISRVCYESYDPDIYVNNTSIVWDILFEKDTFEYSDRKPQIPVTKESEIIDRIMKWMNNKGEQFSPGNRNYFILKASNAFNRYGVGEYSAISFLSKYIESDFTQDEIEKTVKNAYKQKDQHNISYFENIEVKKEIRKDIRSGITNRDISDKITRSNDIKESEAIRIVEEERAKSNNQLETFWTVDFNKKGEITKVELNRRKFITFLHDNGFFRFKLSDEFVIYIRIFDNQVEEVQQHNIKTFVFGWIERMEDVGFDGIDKHFLYEFMAKGVKTYFAHDLLDLLSISDVRLNEDTQDKAYFYYINGAVEVTSKSIQLINYCDLIGKVWKKQIIQRHLVITEEYFNNNYCKFIEKISPTQEQQSAIISIIGYLLHKYKDKRISKAPIITDQQSNDNPEGGSGKGLIIEGIRHIRRVVTMDGKNFDSKKTFAFQRVEADTELIFIDDVPKRFQFENLFSIITEGLTVEKKNKGEYFIPFDKSPKIVLATNYYLKGEGASNDRRKVDVEINNYFGSSYTPFDEFHETLFSDWNNDTWNDFDNSMMFFCQFYLKNNIQTMNNESIQAKKLQANTSVDFIEFAAGIPIGQEVERREIYNEFISAYPGYRKISMRTFLKWTEVYCKHNGLELEKEYRRSHNDFYMLIKKCCTR